MPPLPILPLLSCPETPNTGPEPRWGVELALTAALPPAFLPQRCRNDHGWGGDTLQAQPLALKLGKVLHPLTHVMLKGGPQLDRVTRQHQNWALQQTFSGCR